MRASADAVTATDALALGAVFAWTRALPVNTEAAEEMAAILTSIRLVCGRGVCEYDGIWEQETEQVSWAGFPRFFPANQIVEIFYLAATLQYLKNRPRLSTDESASIQLG